VRIGIIGGGAWGTALAQVAAAGGDVLLWAFEPEVVDAINADHVNPLFLAGVPLSPAIKATNDLGALAACEALLVVTPAQHMRRILGAAPVDARPLILCSKGIEAETMALMSEAATATCPGSCGPSSSSSPRWPTSTWGATGTCSGGSSPSATSRSSEAPR